MTTSGTLKVATIGSDHGLLWGVETVGAEFDGGEQSHEGRNVGGWE